MSYDPQTDTYGNWSANGQWSGDAQLIWTDGKQGDSIEIEFTTKEEADDTLDRDESGAKPNIVVILADERLECSSSHSVMNRKGIE